MKKHITDLIVGLGEPILDEITNNEIVKEIPILGTVVRTARAGLDMRDRWFLKKVHDYIHNIKALSIDQKLKIKNEIEKDLKHRTKFGEAVFSVLEQSDSGIKIKYAACVFLAFVNGDITPERFRQLNYAIKSTFTDYLVDFVEDHKPTDPVLLSDLSNSGLVSTRYKQASFDELSSESSNLVPERNISKAGNQLREAWRKYKSS